MESAKKNSNCIFPPSPSTTRGEVTVIDVNSTLDKLIYCSSNLVIIRDIQDLSICETFNEHIAETSCARFSPNGTLACSGDVKGNIKIWLAKDSEHSLKKSYDNFLSGRIRDIAWTPDGQRLVGVGEGQNQFAKVILVDTGSTIGEITGHSRTILTCVFSPARPFKLITGGEDNNVNLYEGPPFKFKHSDIKSHKNFVTSIAYNPTGDSFISAGSDKKIVIHDVVSGQSQDEITDSSHSGTISSCFYLDSQTLVTASMDKTIKIWNLQTKKCIKKLILNPKPAVEDMQQGATLIKDGVCSLSLNGTLNLWRNVLNVSDDSLPSETAIGHQAPVNVLLYSEPFNVIISGDRNGRTIIWKERKGKIPQGKLFSKALAAGKLSASRKGAYLVSTEGSLKYLDIEKDTLLDQYEANTFVNNLASSKQEEKLCYLAVDKKKILVVDDGKLKTEFNLEFEPLVIETSNDDTKLFVGNKDGIITVLSAQNGEILNKITHKLGAKLTSLGISNFEDKYLVSGDSSKNIVLWNLADLSKITDDWVFHSANIQSLEFNNDNEKVISTGFDNSIILWNTQTQKKEIELRHIHKGGIFRAIFLPNNNIATCGADNLIKEFSLPN